MKPEDIIDFIDMGRRHGWTSDRILTSLYHQAAAMQAKGHRFVHNGRVSRRT